MSEYSDYVDKPVIAPREPLTSKRAVEFLLEGTLKIKVCKYCLNVTSALTDLDQYLKVTGEAGFYKVTVKDMVACFYPYQVTADSNLPDKVCEDCLDHIISSYLFTQQCERADRALRNCFEEVNEKIDKLDPLFRPTTRGRRKANPNTNKITISHKRVIDYADPLMSLVSQSTDMESIDKTKANELECPKCWQEFNNIEALLNHKKSHPNTMWFYCKFCGLSFAKENYYRKHLNTAHAYQIGAVDKTSTSNSFKCNECGIVSENYSTQLQHVEKHKFKGVMEAVLDKNLDQVCSVCFEKGRKMIDMDSMVHFHGGYPGLSGHRNLYNIMDSSLPTRKSRYKYRELLLSNTAKILRMKRNSSMMEDTLNSTKYDNDISQNDWSTRNFTCPLKNKNTKASQTNNNIVDDKSARSTTDDSTEFTFSMPLIIPAKRRKLDLEVTEKSRENFSLPSQKLKNQMYNKPNFFLFNHSGIKTKQNKNKIYVNRVIKNNAYVDKYEHTNKDLFNEALTKSNKIINEIAKAQNESEKDNILKEIDKNAKDQSINVHLLEDTILKEIDKNSENDSDNVHLLEDSTLKEIDKNAENESDNVHLLSFDPVDGNKDCIDKQNNERNVTKDIKSCTSSYDKNATKRSIEGIANACSIEWAFSRASVILRNISPSILQIVEQELSKDSSSLGVEFAFPIPFKCTDNGKKYLCQKSWTDKDTKIEKDIYVKEKNDFNATKTKDDCSKESTQCNLTENANILTNNIKNLNSEKCDTALITEELKTQSNTSKEEVTPPSVIHKKVVLKTVAEDISDKTDYESQTKINKTDGCRKNVYPAILRDCIKLPSSNIESNKNYIHDTINDHIESYERASSSRDVKPTSTVYNGRRDILKQTDIVDSFNKSTSDSWKTIRKRKCNDVSSPQTKEIWECIYCFTNNEPYRVSCFCCGSIKDANKFNITINFGVMKKRRFEQKKIEDSPKENEKKNKESILVDTERESEKSVINVLLPKTDSFTKTVQPITTPLTITTTSTTPTLSAATTLSTISTPTTTSATVVPPATIIISPTITMPSITTIPSTTIIPLPATITTSVVTSFTIPSSTKAKTETITTNPINPIPFNPTTTPLFQFGKPKAIDEIKEKTPTDSSTVPQLILQPLDKTPQDKTLGPQLTLPNNLETGLNTDKSIKKAVKFDDTIKTFNFSDTSNKGIFQFGKPEPKKETISVPQIQSEQKFSALPSIAEIAKQPINHNVLEDIDMTEVTDTSANFNTSVSSLPQQPSILSSIFQTPSTLPKPFGTEQKDTPNTFKAFGNFSTPLSTLSESKPAFDNQIIQSPFTFGNNLNFSIGAAPSDSKGNANAARKTEMRKIRTARRRCN